MLHKAILFVLNGYLKRVVTGSDRGERSYKFINKNIFFTTKSGDHPLQQYFLNSLNTGSQQDALTPFPHEQHPLRFLCQITTHSTRLKAVVPPRGGVQLAIRNCRIFKKMERKRFYIDGDHGSRRCEERDKEKGAGGPSEGSEMSQSIVKTRRKRTSQAASSRMRYLFPFPCRQRRAQLLYCTPLTTFSPAVSALTILKWRNRMGARGFLQRRRGRGRGTYMLSKVAT